VRNSGFNTFRILGAAALLIGCSGSPVNVDSHDRTVRAQSDGDRLTYQYGPIPGAWQRINIEGNDVAWRDPATDGVAHVDHSCERAQDIPLASLAQHLMIGFTGRELSTDETVQLDNRDALHQVVTARLDGVPIMMDLYVMKKDGCVYDLGFVAPPSRFAQGAQAFDQFVHGFHTVATGTPSNVTAGASR
jgi:hypothetical protein